jgi:mono/diheme cytochrome c family protein
MLAKTMGAVAVLGVVGVVALILGAGSGGDDLADYRLPDGKLDMPRLGADVYVENCLICHAADGQGDPPAYPPLAQTKWVNRDKQTPIRILLGGLHGPIVVRGRTYLNQMPSHRQLSDEELAAVLTYVRSHFGNNSPPIEPGDVRALRTEPVPPGGWTAAKLRAKWE